jgi:hypothetical protein
MVVDARPWFVEMVSQHFDERLGPVEQLPEAELAE